MQEYIYAYVQVHKSQMTYQKVPHLSTSCLHKALILAPSLILMILLQQPVVLQAVSCNCPMILADECFTAKVSCVRPISLYWCALK